MVGRDETIGNNFKDEIIKNGGQAEFIKTDIGNVAEVKNCAEKVIEKYGRLDVLVNCAAMMTFDKIIDLDPEKWDELMHVNLKAIFLFCKYFLPHMSSGAVINISSVHAHQTTPNVVPYASSKGAMEAFTRGMSQEYPTSVARFIAVAPGAVDTPMLWSNPNLKSGAEVLTGAIGKPEELAAAVCFLASAEASYINGTTLAVDGGRLAAL